MDRALTPTPGVIQKGVDNFDPLSYAGAQGSGARIFSLSGRRGFRDAGDGSMAKKKSCIAVIDGQGGGIGAVITRELREAFAEEIEIVCLGTNAMATGLMLKAGANRGASGENAIVQTVRTVDMVAGTMGIVIANSMMGELTPKMAEAIASSPATKYLLPLRMPGLEIIGGPKEPLPHLVSQLVKRLKELIEQGGNHV